MKILVVDDSAHNRTPQALAGLEGHELIVFDGVAKTCEFLASGAPFDVALLDLWMPYEHNCVGAFSTFHAEDGHSGDTIAAGAAFALIAAARGLKVAICTDSNHHSDRFVELLDLLSRDRRNRSIIKVEARAAHLEMNGRCVYYHPDASGLVYYDFEGQTKVYYDAVSGERLGELTGEPRIVKDWGSVLGELTFRA